MCAAGVNKMTIGRTLATAAVALAVGVPAAQAGELDQTTGPAGTNCTALSAAQTLAQTFTAGRSGKIDRVDLAIGGSSSTTDPITVEIRNTTSGQPGSNVLTSAVFAANQIPQAPATIGVSLPEAPIVENVLYAIVVYVGGTSTYSWCDAVAPYERGDTLFSQTSPPTTWIFNPGSTDLAFKTYVDLQECVDGLDNDGNGRADYPEDLGCTSASDTTESSPLESVCLMGLSGTSGADTFIGDERANSWYGMGGNDFLAGQGGNDCLYGFGGSDVVLGGAGADVVDGGAGADRLQGENGADEIYGGAGGDHIEAGAANDRVMARDRTADIVDCGGGNADVVVADATDNVSGCENIVLP
jgi:hypothetical protein